MTIKPDENGKNGLGGKVLRGTIWVTILAGFSNMLSLARLFVFARILSPQDFGLFTLATLLLAALQSFSETGISVALIQNRGDARHYLNAAWTVQIIRGLVLSAIVIAIAPFYADFFHEYSLSSFLRILSLSIFIKGFTNIGIIYFRKELDLRKQAFYEMSGQMTDLIVSMILVFILRNVWGLILGLIARSTVELAMSFALHPYRPSISLDRSQTREFSTFGRWIFGSTALIFIANQLDRVFIGRILGASLLGYYYMGLRISEVSFGQIAVIIDKVLFPTYAKIQDNVDQLRRYFTRTLESIIFVALPLAVMIFFMADDFVPVVLGPKWNTSIPVIKVLAVAGLIRAFTAMGGALYNACGRPQIDFWLNLLRVSVMLVTIGPLTYKYGIVGTAWAFLIGRIITVPPWLFYSMKLTNTKFRAFGGRLYLLCLPSLFLFIFVVAVKVILSTSLPNFIFTLLSSGFFYIGITLLFWKLFKVAPDLPFRFFRVNNK